MPSQEKKDKVKQIKKWFEKSDSLLVLHYRGLKVSEASELREKVKEMNSELRVIKNTLTRIALADTPNEGLTPMIDGPVAVVLIHDDPAPVARSLREFSKGRKDFYLLGGMLDGQVLTGKEVEAFAMLPSREVLLAQALGTAAAPLCAFVSVLAGPIRKLIGVVQAIADSAPAGAPEAEQVTDADSPPEAEQVTDADSPPEAQTASDTDVTAETPRSGEDADVPGTQSADEDPAGEPREETKETTD